MPETANYGFEYETPQSKPGITLTGDIDGSAPILAEQVDTVISGIDTRLTGAEGTIAILEAGAAHDTGWLAMSVAAGAGFTLVSAVYRLWGPLVGIRFEFERTGADIVANASGNVVGDPPICTINTIEARPSEQQMTLVQASLTSGGGRIGTNGVCDITDLHSNSSILTGHFVRVSGTYFGSTFN